jgi:addiction module HigA family antidote
MNDKIAHLPIPHPGETLLEDFMKPLALTSARVAKDLGVSVSTISLMIRGRAPVTPELALRLARYTKTSPDFWLGLQEDHDLRKAERKLSRRIEREVQPCPFLATA